MKNLLTLNAIKYKTNYSADMAMFKTVSDQRRIALVILLGLIFPLFTSNYVIGLATLCGIASIGAIGLNILTGYSGQISIGAGAFLGVGGYASAILTSTVGLSFWIALPLAGIITALVGGAFGIPSLRLKGLYLAIATLAAQFVILFIITRWVSLTGGTSGMVLNRPEIAGFTFATNTSYYYLTIIILIFTALFATNLIRTKPGRAFLAVRDRDVAAQIMGVNLFKSKVLAFMISSFFIGISGALLAHFTMIVSPEFYHINVSIEYLAMILIGGLGSVLGSILGAVFITLLPLFLTTMLDFISMNIVNLGNIVSSFEEFIFGLVIILFLIFEPGGLAAIWNSIKTYFKLWPFSR